MDNEINYLIAIFVTGILCCIVTLITSEIMKKILSPKKAKTGLTTRYIIEAPNLAWLNEGEDLQQYEKSLKIIRVEAAKLETLNAEYSQLYRENSQLGIIPGWYDNN